MDNCCFFHSGQENFWHAPCWAGYYLFALNTAAKLRLHGNVETTWFIVVDSHGIQQLAKHVYIAPAGSQDMEFYKSKWDIQRERHHSRKQASNKTSFANVKNGAITLQGQYTWSRQYAGRSLRPLLDSKVFLVRADVKIKRKNTWPYMIPFYPQMFAVPISCKDKREKIKF